MNRNEEYGTLTAFTALSPLAVGGLIGLAGGGRPQVRIRD